jgi:hypothetical protein
MTESFGRVIGLVAVAAGLYWAVTTFVFHQTPGGPGKAEAAVASAATARGWPANGVRCQTDPTPPQSIGYVRRMLSQTSGVKLYFCTTPSSTGSGLQPWCAVVAPGPSQGFAESEPCNDWAASGQ